AAAGAIVGLVSALWSYDKRLQKLEEAVEEGMLVDRGVASERPGPRARRDARPPGERRRELGGKLRMRPRVSSEGDRGPSLEMDEDLAQQVRGVVREERQELESEQREQFRAMFTERTEARMNRFAEEFQVSNEHREALTNALINEIDASMELRRDARRGERSIDEVREEIRALRDQTSSQAKELLNETQYEAFQAGRRGPGGGGGPPWRGRGGGGFGPPG
ncbi:MAG: hypothetical protein ACPHRO_06230, partial [Nannocystaceae bacterium]